MTSINGNCQYSAMAESCIQVNADTMEDEESKRVIGLVKKIIVEAFEQDLKDETVRCAADMLTKKQRTETPHQALSLLRKRFTELAASTIKRDHTLPYKYWGSHDTMRLFSKALDEPVFCVHKDTNAEHPICSAVKPVLSKQELQSGTHYFNTAADFYMPWQEWLEALIN